MPSNAGFFLWADLTPWLHAFKGDTPLAKERAMNEALLDGGLHLATSEAFFGEDNGWFRITFSVETETLIVGLKRSDTGERR
jgi:1-aminocyclopropane-1-carboxylate synthase